MPRVRPVTRALNKIEALYDRAKYRVRRPLRPDQIMIAAYLGHGTAQALHLRGRVLRDKGITSAMPEDSAWKNMVNMYKRYQSRELPGAVVRARFGEHVQETVADEEGFFAIAFHLPMLPYQEDGRYTIDLELVDYPGRDRYADLPLDVRATGTVIVPRPGAEFGVISDIDDTVLQTDVLNLLAMARNAFLKNAHTRLPFDGVAAFYDALRRGGSGLVENPIYYVSSSAWNIYDVIKDFFIVREIPVGPIFLADWGLTPKQLLTPNHLAHKLGHIQNLLDTHADLPFILIGDSGQKDPEIYVQAVKDNPGRILAVYIRDVTGRSRDASLHALIAEAAAHGVELVVAQDTYEAAVHAAERGYISRERLPEIRAERDEDRTLPTPLEHVLKPGSAASAHIDADQALDRRE